jgi:hypothetical protein
MREAHETRIDPVVASRQPSGRIQHYKVVWTQHFVPR